VRPHEKLLGYAADYCPICRNIEAFQIFESRLRYHLWYLIPVGRGESLGYKKLCEGCETKSEGFLNAYRELSRSPRKSLDDLIAKTNPVVRETYKEKLAFADRLETDTVGLDETARHRLMMEAFSLAEPHFSSGFGHQGKRILTVSLRPLAPKEEEIRACLQRYRDTGSRMGARLRTEDVMELLYPETVVKDRNKFSY